MLTDRSVRDAVDAVDVLSIEIDIRFSNLPSVVLPDQSHPLGMSRRRHASAENFAAMQERVAAVELFRYYDRLSDESLWIGEYRFIATD